MKTVTGPAASPPGARFVEEIDDESPFWAPNPRWPVLPTREPRRRPQRRPALGLLALIVLALTATFVGWVSAEPLWLAMGHGERGTATVTPCAVRDAPYECVTFTAAGGRFAVEDVALLGTDRSHLRQGTSISAHMVSPHSRRAYALDPMGIGLRAAVGLALVLLCGLGLAWATGATRLDHRGSRRRACLACVAAPLLLTLGFLAATW
jgi:hypothetical protein